MKPDIKQQLQVITGNPDLNESEVVYKLKKWLYDHENENTRIAPAKTVSKWLRDYNFEKKKILHGPIENLHGRLHQFHRPGAWEIRCSICEI